MRIYATKKHRIRKKKGLRVKVEFAALTRTCHSFGQLRFFLRYGIRFSRTARADCSRLLRRLTVVGPSRESGSRGATSTSWRGNSWKRSTRFYAHSALLPVVELVTSIEMLEMIVVNHEKGRKIKENHYRKTKCGYKFAVQKTSTECLLKYLNKTKAF